MTIGARSFEIGELASVRGGYAFRGSIEAVAHGSVWAVQMKDFTAREGVNWSTVARTELPHERSADWLADGDILFVCRGTGFYAASIDTPPIRAVCATHFLRLRVHRQARVLPAFLAWLINQPPLQRQLHQAAEGSNQLSIRRPVLESLSVRIPNPADQHRIVALAQLAYREQQTLRQLIRNRDSQLEALAEELSADSTRTP